MLKETLRNDLMLMRLITNSWCKEQSRYWNEWGSIWNAFERIKELKTEIHNGMKNLTDMSELHNSVTNS